MAYAFLICVCAYVPLLSESTRNMEKTNSPAKECDQTVLSTTEHTRPHGAATKQTIQIRKSAGSPQNESSSWCGGKKHYCQVVRWNNSWLLLASSKSFAFASSSKCIGNSEKDKIVKFIRRIGSVKSVVSVVTNVGEYDSKRLFGCARNGAQSRLFPPAKSRPAIWRRQEHFLCSGACRGHGGARSRLRSVRMTSSL